MRYLPDNNLSYPVLIELNGSSGSGFYLNFEETTVYLVTAYHVLFDPQTNKIRSGSVNLISYDSSNLAKKLILTVDLSLAVIIADATRDTVTILMGDVANNNGAISTKWKSYVKKTEEGGEVSVVVVLSSNLKKFDQVLESNEVFLLGYPNSLGSTGQIEIKRPLLRKGIVAGKNYANRTIIVDCPVYFGNSGGLTIEVEEIESGKRKFSIIGIVTQYIPFIERLQSLQMGYTNMNMENSGYGVVVPADVIQEIIRNSKNVSK
jgi:hypothetical protein